MGLSVFHISSLGVTMNTQQYYAIRDTLLEKEAEMVAEVDYYEQWLSDHSDESETERYAYVAIERNFRATRLRIQRQKRLRWEGANRIALGEWAQVVAQ